MMCSGCAGKIGGKAKVAKGFSSPAVLARALATRKANRERVKVEKQNNS